MQIDCLWLISGNADSVLNRHGVIIETALRASQHMGHFTLGEFKVLFSVQVKAALANPYQTLHHMAFIIDLDRQDNVLWG